MSRELQSANGPAHVLIVEDEPAVADHIAEIVTNCGHRVSACNSWTDALRAFGQGDIDLVLMDAVMPTVDGFKLTRILRSRASTYVPIVFLTGLNDMTSRTHGVEAGGDDFLTKPIDPLELRVRMTAMLRIRSLTKALEEKTRTLSRIATMDALTGIGNRRSFDERLPIEFNTASEGAPLALLLLDIDHFKTVNDVFGHQTGDELLREFGRLLADATRACDLPYRYGGEEFAILCPNATAASAFHLAERVRAAFESSSGGFSEAGPQTCSIGVADTETLVAGDMPSSLIAAADAAMYRAKESGRNRVCCYDTFIDSKAA